MFFLCDLMYWILRCSKLTIKKICTSYIDFKRAQPFGFDTPLSWGLQGILHNINVLIFLNVSPLATVR